MLLRAREAQTFFFLFFPPFLAFFLPSLRLLLSPFVTHRDAQKKRKLSSGNSQQIWETGEEELSYSNFFFLAKKRDRTGLKLFLSG